MRIYIELLKYIVNIKKEITHKVLLGLTLSATYLLQAAFMSGIVNAVWQHKDMKYLISSILIVVALITIRGTVSRWIEGYNKILSAEIKGKIRNTVIEKNYALGPGYMNARRSGDVISMLQDGIENLEPFCVNYIPQLFGVLLTFFTERSGGGSRLVWAIADFSAVIPTAVNLSVLLCMRKTFARLVSDYEFKNEERKE